ncbi:Hsp70 family protein [Altererythrobacter xixiisoli]|uniref:Hsp70 family protein n=1 Tax=Croceibacterium xixiisoli TaxID=1476466 RepID=A0A6I4TX27_9SPHN|nr:Hsp70 family protein [Croceibacterium xixiisoli]MXO99739.1 Hsp70 family protein [Croceibacterium xixiisoli]
MLIGIDLGTTNSAVAIWRDGTAELVPNALGSFLTPSAVSVAKDGTIWVGAAALDRLATHPAETATSFKRMMGTQRSVRLGNKRDYSPEDLSALVLASLRDDVTAMTGETPTEAVITVPAYFNDRQRKATRRAGELAGLTVKRLINEPTAAALAYGLQDRDDREPFLVFDLGGGTFDVSIVEMFDGVVEVRASTGDNRLGGDDFNLVMIQLARPKLQADMQLQAMQTDKREALLFLAAERARRQLTVADTADFSITIGDTAFTAQVSGEEFEAQSQALLKRLREPVIRSLRDCGMSSQELSEIVLVGGATRMPVVRKSLTRMFGRFPNSGVHPDHAVALGAAAQAGLIERGGGLDEIRITDVAPFTLGVDVAERDTTGGLRQGIFSPIIDRNTPIPTSREHVYSTLSDNQREVRLGIFQGEARMVADNIKLDELRIPVPAAPAGQIAVHVRFTYDSSGLLEVDASVPASGLTRNLVIVDEEDRRDKAELERRRAELAKLKFHPRDEAENVALLARANRCYENFTGPARDMVGQWIGQFEAVVERQDPRDIASAREQLTRGLDDLEGQSPL